MFRAAMLLLLLAGCATPRQQCVEAATQDLRRLDRQIAESRAIVDRGYAIRVEPTAGPRLTVCYGDRDRHVGVLFCNDAGPRTRRVSEPVDLDAERAKLAVLTQKRATIARRAKPAVAECRARFPAE